MNNNNNSRLNFKSNAIKTLQDENSVHFEHVNPGTFINVLEDDIIYRVVYDHDAQERNKKDYLFPEFQHDINTDHETEVPTCINHTINNYENTVSTEPYLLTPPIDYNLSCTDFDIDDSYES